MNSIVNSCTVKLGAIAESNNNGVYFCFANDKRKTKVIYEVVAATNMYIQYVSKGVLIEKSWKHKAWNSDVFFGATPEYVKERIKDNI
jgi:hypothetical protein